MLATGISSTTALYSFSAASAQLQRSFSATSASVSAQLQRNFSAASAQLHLSPSVSHSHSCLLLRWRFSATRDDRWTLVILVRGIVCRNKNWGSPGRWCCYVTSQTEVHLKMCPRGWARPEGSLSFLFFLQFFSPFRPLRKICFKRAILQLNQ